MPLNADQRTYLSNFLLGFLLAGAVIAAIYFVTRSMDTTGNILIGFSATVIPGMLLLFIRARRKKVSGK